jgi:RecA/RadA recombinase
MTPLLLVPPAPLPASRMRNDALSTGCSNLDRILRGGVKTKSMTEFVGENGSGKTQLCLQLLLETVASGGRRRFGGEEEDGDEEDEEEEEEEEDANEGFSAVYVTTEGQFPVERLREMWRERRKIQRRRHREKRKSRNIDVQSDAREEDAERKRRREEEEERREDEEDEKRALDSIYVFQAMGNAENCWEVLRSISTVLSSTESSNSDSINRRGKKKKRRKKEGNGSEMVKDDDDDDDDETEIRRKPVKLIVIDSLTAPFREDLEEGDAGKSEKHRNMQRVILRAQFLYRFTHLLKEFAWKHNLAVVVTNHVVDSFDDDDDDNYNIRNNINAPPRKQENNSGGFRASNDDYSRERAKGEEKDAIGEEETDCYGKRAFPKRFYTSNRFVKPGLGLAWANCPNSSIFLTRADDDADGGGGGFGRAEGDNNSLRRRRRRRRWADAFRSPFAEAQSCAFRIETEGIVNDDDEVDE